MKRDHTNLVTMLFSKEIEDLDDDGFEGSIDEHRIFKEVFFEKDEGRSSKRCPVTQVINFEYNKSKHKAMSRDANSDNSAITSHEDFYYVKENTTGSFGRGCQPEEDNMNIEQVKLSVDELSCAKSYLGSVLMPSDCSKRVISDLFQPSLDFSFQNMNCYLVESSSQGLISSCCMVQHQGKMDMGDMNDSITEKNKLSNIDQSCKLEAVATRAIASPISQESYANKLFAISSSVAVENNSEPAQCPKPKWKDSCFLRQDISEIPQITESTNDPRPLLRYYCHCLFRAAGWLVGRRKRLHGTGEFIFKSPEGRPIREFYRAWSLCGERLVENLNNKMQPADDMQWTWTDMSEFWSDLCHTLSEFEEQVNSSNAIATLVHCWCLLDPFAHVVFIDKKLGLLKSGKVIKAKKTSVIRLYSKCDEQVFRGKEGSQLNPCFLSVYGSESTCEQTVACQFDVSSANVNTSEIVSDHQESITSPRCCDKVRSEHEDRMAFIKDVYMGSYEGVGKIFQKEDTAKLTYLLPNPSDNHLKHANGFTIDAISKRKAHKKLKRISEIKLTAVHQNNFGLSTLCDVGSHKINIDGIHLEQEVQDYLTCSIRNNGNYKKSSFISHQQWKHKKQNKVKNVTKIVHSRGPNFLGNNDEEIEMFDCKNGQKISCQLKDDDLLISAVINVKNSRYASKPSTAKGISREANALRKRRSQKGRCRLLPRSLNKGGKHFMEGKWFAFGVRTVLFWLINCGIISLNELIQYRNLKDGTVVKNGLVTKDGILCRCCDKVFSLSAFKSHAGFKMNRPCLNLFMESGKPFTLCQLEAWSAEYKARKSTNQTVPVDEMDQNDDSCGLCGDGGELLCCDNCPSTFHQSCLFAQELPEGNWYCRHCTCQICGDVVKVKEPQESNGALQCLQCDHKYHEACLTENLIGTNSDTWFCSQSCREIYSGLTSRIGFMNLMSDGISWMLLRCIHGNQKVHSAQRFIAMKAECNSKLAVALTIMEECFLPMVDPRTGIDMIPHVLYNWGSQFARLNYSGFYTVGLEKDDVLLSVASLRIHGVTVAEMPLIATCSKYRRQGMCRRLINSVEEMLKSFKVEMLVISAIPSLVETWTVGFGFKTLEDREKQCLSKINLMVFPGTIWLKKSLCENQAEDQQMGARLTLALATDDHTEPGPCSEGSASDDLRMGEVLDVPLHEQAKTSLLGDAQLELLSHLKSVELNDDKHLDTICDSPEIKVKN